MEWLWIEKSSRTSKFARFLIFKSYLLLMTSLFLPKFWKIIHSDPRMRHGKRMFVGVSRHVTRDVLWRVSGAWHDRVTPLSHPDRNKPEQLSGCYEVLRGVMSSVSRREIRNVSVARPVCGDTWPQHDNRWIKFWNLSLVLWSIFWSGLYKGIRHVTTQQFLN